ncbi:FAD-dependent oxidoreductase [Haladaptatus sp. F3-133]|uniref:FAD-dependent oxidoreductase n=1 Tax=Halorutilus salinus TaxID=2487751 RepID=A0A9Q4C4Y1_9EURY|nr:FAD-dependent oxidoreductase [Halorutilus salinus]
MTDMTDTTVAVIGGGVGGMTTAHELAERGFDVSVYEKNDALGGKSRSIETEDGYPGEHGFRFLPGFYKHLRGTMSRIPDGEGTVRDNLVETTEMLRCFGDGEKVRSPEKTPRTPGELIDALRNMLWRDAVPSREHDYFLNRFLTLATSCDARWRNEYENTSWWEFTDADEMSPEYRKYLVRGATKVLVAMDPEESSARTIGRMTVQTVADILDPRRDVEILNAPTTEAWIAPWRDLLEGMGVDIHVDSTAESVGFDGERVTGIVVDGERVEADYYVLATPVEVTRRLVTDRMREADASLASLDRLKTDWMSGVQFYLEDDVPLVRGHGIYFDSPWALTSISQRQFWDVGFDRYDGIEGILSVCISDWDSEGVVYGKTAKDCTRDEVAREVWTQLKHHLNDEDTVLDDGMLVGWYLDEAIQHDDEKGRNENEEPLLVNTVGSLRHRPDASTAIPNLTLAADYVRTNTDLATMEGANEAGRRATNAILEREGSSARRCEVYELEDPRIFEPFKRMDAVRHRLGLPHVGETTKGVWKRVLVG